jgi:hypothetical protein
MARWLNISLFNLVLVAAFGVTLRYKIAFYLPFIEQKYVLHAHSHFAFSGWVTQTLIVLLVQYLDVRHEGNIFKKYKPLLLINLFAAYGMLISFTLQGYGFYSIFFSSISVANSYVFSFVYWKDLSKIEKRISHKWFRAALLFNILSSAGTFVLAYMMANKIGDERAHLASVYYYLHFQYNGWFFFAIMGLLFDKIDGRLTSAVSNRIFLLFAGACIPAYFLSILWLKVPLFLTIIIIVASFMQIAGWTLFVVQVKKLHDLGISSFTKKIWILAGIALTIKLLLQLGSTHPFLSQLAFGFRPVVIAYLHLVLLGVLTLFLLGNIYDYTGNTGMKRGILFFTVAVILNETALMVQGVAGIAYIGVPYINQILFVIAVMLLAGASWIALSYRKPIL